MTETRATKPSPRMSWGDWLKYEREIMDELEWIENWYKSECNGDWEHQYGVKIETSDNPGWIITIDIKDTPLEGLEIEYKLYENSEDDWFGLSIKENIFSAAGDAKKLRFLLSKFKEIVENKK